MIRPKPKSIPIHTNPLKSCKKRRIALGIQESSKYVINIRSRLIISITNTAGLNSILLCEPSIGVQCDSSIAGTVAHAILCFAH